MFQIKDFASIAASCINWMRSTQKKVTDFSVGSVARTIVEAPAAEIEELYLRMFLGLKEAIPVAIYRTFDFERLPATPASGTIRVQVSPSTSDLLIPAGTGFLPVNYGVTFQTVSDVFVAAGQSQADIPVLAQTAGTGGNIPAGTALDPTQSISGFVSAVALFSFSSGTDEETDEERKTRFATFVATLNRGTLSALRYGLSLAFVRDSVGAISERVRYHRIVEPWLADPNQPVALVQAYIHNGGSTGASSDLIVEAQKIIDGYYDENGDPVAGWKAAGVRVDVIGASTTLVAVTGVVTIAGGYQSAAVTAEVQAAVADYIASLDIGETVIRSEIIAAAMGVDGVTNFIPSAPAADTAIGSTAKAMPGTIALTVA